MEWGCVSLCCFKALVHSTRSCAAHPAAVSIIHHTSLLCNPNAHAREHGRHCETSERCGRDRLFLRQEKDRSCSQENETTMVVFGRRRGPLSFLQLLAFAGASGATGVTATMSKARTGGKPRPSSKRPSRERDPVAQQSHGLFSLWGSSGSEDGDFTASQWARRRRQAFRTLFSQYTTSLNTGAVSGKSRTLGAPLPPQVFHLPFRSWREDGRGPGLGALGLVAPLEQRRRLEQDLLLKLERNGGVAAYFGADDPMAQLSSATGVSDATPLPEGARPNLQLPHGSIQTRGYSVGQLVWGVERGRGERGELEPPAYLDHPGRISEAYSSAGNGMQLNMAAQELFHLTKPNRTSKERRNVPLGDSGFVMS